MTLSHWSRRALLAAVLFGMTACGNPFADSAPTRSQIVAGGWVGPTPMRTQGTIYCYRTLAVPDCRTTPEPGQEDRLVSNDGNNYASPPR